MAEARRLAIVGGGYSAVALLLGLAERRRHAPDATIDIDVFEPREVLGQGLAYTPWEWQDGGPLLNVPAGRMGPSLARLDDFARWWAARGGRAADFAPRADYGRYLAEVLKTTLAANPWLRVRHLRTRVEGLERGDVGWHLMTPDGVFDADQVVLAFGHEPRGLPPGAWHAPGWIADPWSHGDALDQLPPQAPVVLIGSGLTAVDVWQRLSRRPGLYARPPVTLISRHGWLPQPHRPHDAPPPGGLLPPDVLASAERATAVLSGLRQLVRQQAKAGADWRDVMADLRQYTPRIWRQLPPDEQRRALRHGMAAWDTHRHRAAPTVAAQLDRARASGQLGVMAARLVSWTPNADGAWRLSLQSRHGGMQELNAAAIINCTGPSPDACTAALQLRSQGLAQGWYQLAANGIGPAVNSRGQMLAADGEVQQTLWLLGPALRAAHWEATAVPELREHAARLAASLLP